MIPILLLTTSLVSHVIAVSSYHDDNAWQAWKSRYGKTYASLAEEASARDVWRRHTELIQSYNSRPGISFTLQMNQFGDQVTQDTDVRLSLTRKTHTLFYVPDSSTKSKRQEPPTNFDWRTRGMISPVKTQTKTGSAEAIVVTEVLESLHAILSGHLLSLSVQEVEDCCSEEPAGLVPDIFECIARHGGLCDQKSYSFPPDRNSTVCKNDSCHAVANDANVTVHIAKGDESEMLTAVLLSPLVVYIDASRPSFRFYKSGIYNVEDEGNEEGIVNDDKCGSKLDHVLQLVGYGQQNGVPYWILQNSWGTTWGKEGYIWIKRGSNVCGLADHVLYPKWHQV